ncbi:MAG TPA: UbiA family prenyltransferase [Candidatus Polarisedimenticolaceae bacterium]|nr:UbiA family prenyltransferase [Candidatus Polarisedimenticolaceae bacterium]
MNFKVASPLVEARERTWPLPPPSGAHAGAALWDFLVHLRLPFQLALSVVVLWGVVWSGGALTLRFLWVWLAWTVPLSGGATAYNSYFDRDEGPVGGLRRPPRVRPSMLWLSLALQLTGGVLLALSATWLDVGVYVLGALVFFAYSTPGIRTKSRPWRATATVALGSGALASLAGSLAAGGGPNLGMLSSALFIAGFYPLTQLGQIDEDRRRGDRTFAVALGRNAGFAWSGVVLPLACALNLWRVGSGSVPARVLLLGLAPVALSGILWWRRPGLDASPIADYLAYTAAVVFAVAALLV